MGRIIENKKMGKAEKKGARGNGRRMGTKNGNKHNSKNTRQNLASQRHHDQIHKDLKDGITIKEDPDLPGMGRYYCVSCARYFIDDNSLKGHEKTSLHKRRLKMMKQKPHTYEDAELFAGLQTEKIRPNIKPNADFDMDLDAGPIPISSNAQSNQMIFDEE